MYQLALVINCWAAQMNKDISGRRCAYAKMQICGSDRPAEEMVSSLEKLDHR